MMDRLKEIQKAIKAYDKKMKENYRVQQEMRNEIEKLQNEAWDLQEAKFWADHPGIVLEQNSQWITEDGIVLTYITHYQDDETGEVEVYMNCEPITLERARKLKPLLTNDEVTK